MLKPSILPVLTALALSAAVLDQERDAGTFRRVQSDNPRLAAPAGATQDPTKSTPADELAAGETDPALLRKLAWVCGTWVQQQGNVTVEEHWRPLQGTTILGTSHTFDGEKSHFFEFLRIAHRAGSISYVAMPGGAPPTLFRLVKLENGLMVFENPKHDHPQRIRYERTEDGIKA